MTDVASTASGEPKGDVIQVAMTPAQFTTLQGRAGIPAAETSGEIFQKGVHAQWSYADGLLQAKILHKPMFATVGMIRDHFRSWAGL
jgi:hypothetical protein